MRSILNQNALVFATLLTWLLASWSGVHGHMCFDGKEPPIEVHIHGVDDHADHHSDEQHLDADVNLSQALLIKLNKIDLPLLIAATLLLTVLFEKVAPITFSYSQIFPSNCLCLRPPLRAPPTFPA